MIRFFEKILCALIIVWFFTLFLRSGIHAIRLGQEFLGGQVAYWPEISACESRDGSSNEERYVANYRSLGVKCQ